MKIEIEKPTTEHLERKGVSSWLIWEKEISRFDWHYDSTEECYLLEGEVVVEAKDGEQVKFGKGDFVTFPKGLSCTWDVRVPVEASCLDTQDRFSYTRPTQKRVLFNNC